MGRRRAAIAFIVCAAVLGALAFLANNVYRGVAYDDWTIFLFHEPVTEPYGKWLWASLKPLLALAALATAWALYGCVRVWFAARPAGVCHTCGYDLRATPDRCPECGAVVKGAPNVNS